MPLSMDPHGLAGEVDRDEHARLASQFAASHWMRLPGLLSPALLERVQDELERSAFSVDADGVATTERAVDGPATALLHLVSNDPAFFRFLERVTGSGPITVFISRVYRMHPGPQHRDSWHGDTGIGRVLAMSLNVGREPYIGGDLELRPTGGGSTLCRVSNPRPGDAIVFRIAPALEHRLTPVEGTASKLAYAGWFASGPTTRDWLGLRGPHA